MNIKNKNGPNDEHCGTPQVIVLVFESKPLIETIAFCHSNVISSNYSINYVLIGLTEQIKSHLDMKQLVCGIFVDLEKPLDTVNHQILYDKLSYYGFRGGFN